MDRFLRALIVYFQSYIQVWDSLILKREEVKKKLYQPVVTEMENVIRDDLADLRAMVAREYCSILIGAEESKQFHHMSSSDNTSLSDKDRKMFEMFICMSVRVVWIALQRKHLSLIELETNRLLRTDIFNLSAHRGIKGGADLCKNASEERILTGTANTEERKLLHRSPITKELILGDHEHRMLIIGNKQFQPTDERLNYLEVAYAAPEEHLLEMGLVVGMLGIPRAEYDAMLMTVVREAKQTSRCRMMPVFKLPPKEYHSEIPKEFPKEPTRFPETRQKINARKTQCKMWLKTLKKAYEGREMSILDLSVTQSHVLLLTSRSSVSVVPRASQ